MYVTADENHIKVVLRNLVSNAIKFTNSRGQIIISTRQEDKTVVICVRDTGVGMTQEEVGKLFNHTQHFSQSGTMGEKGIGIGLLLCKELVTLNNGKIWVETGTGEGCKVCFSLPLADI